MSTFNDAESSGASQVSQTRARRRFLTGMMTGGCIGSLLAGGFHMYAQAQYSPDWWFQVGHAPGGYFRHASHDPEMMIARIEFAADWLLSRIAASDTQRQQVRVMVQATIEDLSHMREQHMHNRQMLLQALARPTIDRATLGDIRHASLQLADMASERIIAVLADIAEVLTPEQRTALAEITNRWHN